MADHNSIYLKCKENKPVLTHNIEAQIESGHQGRSVGHKS